MTRLSGQGIGAHNTLDLAPGFSLHGNLPTPGPHLSSWMMHDEKRVHLLLSAPYAVKWLFKSQDLGIPSPLAMDNSPSLRNELWDADAAAIPLLHNLEEAWAFICQEIKKKVARGASDFLPNHAHSMVGKWRLVAWPLPQVSPPKLGGWSSYAHMLDDHTSWHTEKWSEPASCQKVFFLHWHPILRMITLVILSPA